MAYLNNQLTKLAWFGSDDQPAQPTATDLAFDNVRKAITDEHKEKFNEAAESAADRATLIGAGLGAGAGAGLSGAYAVGSSLKGGKLGSRLWNLVTNKGSNVSRTSRIANKLWKGRSLKGKAGLIAAPVLAMLGGGYLNRKLSQGQSDSMRESMFGPQVQAAAEEAVQKEASFNTTTTNMGYLNTSMTKRAMYAAPLAAAAAGTLGAGALGGGLMGHYDSDKENKVPATVLGALGGATGAGAGAAVGAGASIVNNLLVDSAEGKIADLAHRKARLAEALKGATPITHATKRQLQREAAQAGRALRETPSALKFLARHPRLRTATALGLLAAPTVAGGALGAKLGTEAGDAIA